MANTNPNSKLKDKLESLTSEDIYNMLIRMNFPEEVAKFFKEKTNCGVKKFLFDELQANPIQNVYLNIVLMKLLNEISERDNSKIKFPFNIRDPLLINEDSAKSFLAYFPPVKTKKLQHSNENQCIVLADEPSISKKEKLNQIWSNFLDKNTQNKSTVRANQENLLKPIENNIIKDRHSDKNDLKKHETIIVVNQSVDEQENDFNISNLIYKIKVNSKYQIISLLDSDFKLPEFSPHIEDALNDEDDCLEVLEEMSQEIAEFLISNGFYSLSQNEYKAVVLKLLNKYDILYGMLNRKVEDDFKQKITHIKQKPEGILQKHISLELIKYRMNEKHLKIKNKIDSNNNSPKKTEKKKINHFFSVNKNEAKSQYEAKKLYIENWLNDSSEALCDI